MKLKLLVKLAASGATIFAIGLGISVLQPDPHTPVATANADIASFSFAPKSQQQRFVETLKKEGMEKPRAYNHNGNRMFFSTTTTRESPREVLARFQRGFVDNGVNEQVHLSPFSMADADAIRAVATQQDPQLADRLGKENDVRSAQMNDFIGGVLPVLVEDHHVIMTGTTTPHHADNWQEYLQEMVDRKDERLPDDSSPITAVKAMRYLEAYRENDATRIIAVWSDEEYEPGKIVDRGEDLNVDAEIPSCPGCRRLYNVQGESEHQYSTAAYTGSGRSVDQLVHFYDETLQAKGWQLSPTAKVLESFEEAGIKQRTDGTMLQYSRGDQFLTLVAWPDEDGASVHLARSN